MTVENRWDDFGFEEGDETVMDDGGLGNSLETSLDALVRCHNFQQ